MSPAFSIVKRRGPSLPCRSLNPLTGIREVPVVNCSSRDFFSASHDRIAYISHYPPRDYLPEPLHNIITLGIPSIIGMLFPIVYIHLCNTTDKQLQFPLIKDINQILRDKFIESLREAIKLFLNAFLDTPVCHEINVFLFIFVGDRDILPVFFEIDGDDFAESIVFGGECKI